MPIGSEAGSIIYAIKSNIASLKQGITAAKMEMGKLGGFVQANAAQFRGLGIASTLAGGAITAALGLAVKSAGDVEKAYADVKAVSDELKGGTEAAAESMKRVEAVAEDLGKKTKFSTKEVAEGMKFVAMAGYDVNEMLTAMPGLVNLAAAADQDLAFAADALTNILSGFGETAQETGRFVDVMAYTAANANVNLSEMAEALKYVAPAAKDMGLSIEQTSAMIGKLGDAGIKGSMAGRNMRMAFIKWMQLESAGFTKKQAGVMADFAEKMMGAGKTANDLQAAITSGDITFQEFITRMREAGATTGDFSSIFGAAAATQISILADQSEAVTDFTKRLEGATGAAEEMANIKLDTFKGQMDVLKGSVETFAASIGKILIPHLVDMMKKATEITNSLMEWTKEHKWLTEQVVKFAAVIGPLMLVGGPMMIMAPTIMNVVGSMKSLIGVIPAMIKGLIALHVAIGPIGWAIEAIIAGIVLLYFAWTKNWGGIQEKTRAVVNTITKYFIKFVNFMTQNVINPIITAYETFYNTILKGVGWLVEKIIGLFAKLPSPILKAFGTTKEEVMTFAADVRKKFKLEFKKIPKIAEDALKWKEPIEKAKKDMEGLKEGIVKIKHEVGEFREMSEHDLKQYEKYVASARAETEKLAETTEETAARVKKAWEEMEEPEQKRLRAIEKVMDASIQLGLTLEQAGVSQADAMMVLASASEGYLSMTEETMDKFRELLLNSIEEIGSQMGVEGERLAEAFLYGKSPGGFLPTIKKGLQKYLLAIYEEEEKAILGSWNAFLDEVAGVTFETYEQLTSYLEDLNTKDRNKLFEKRQDWARTYVSIADKAKEQLDRIAGVWKDFASSIKYSVRDMFVDLLKGVSSFKEGWNSLVEVIKNRFLAAMAEAVLIQMKFNELLESIDWTAEDLGEQIDVFMEKVHEGLETAFELVGKVADKVKDKFEDWKEPVEETIDAVKELGRALGKTYMGISERYYAEEARRLGLDEEAVARYVAAGITERYYMRQDIKGYPHGGIVEETGLAHLEKGEVVTPVGGGPQITVNFMPGTRISDIDKPTVRRLAEELRPILLEFDERKIG